MSVRIAASTTKLWTSTCGFERSRKYSFTGTVQYEDQEGSDSRRALRSIRELGGFGEIEYHTLAAKEGARLVGSSDVWSFSGPRDEIKATMEAILTMGEDYV